jgi:hypothetical protein
VEEDRIFRDVEGGLNAFGCYTIEEVGKKNRFILDTLVFLLHRVTLCSSLLHLNRLFGLGVHLQRDAMRPTSLSGVIQFKPRIPERPIILWRQHKLGHVALGALEPAILDSHTSALGKRNFPNLIHDFRMRIPCVLISIHCGFNTMNKECVWCLARQGAGCVLGRICVDVEVYAANGGGHVGRNIERDFGVNGVADLASRLGSIGRVGCS